MNASENRRAARVLKDAQKLYPEDLELRVKYLRAMAEHRCVAPETAAAFQRALEITRNGQVDPVPCGCNGPDPDPYCPRHSEDAAPTLEP